MNGSTVNIADFRCRVMNARAGQKPFRAMQSTSGLALVESRRKRAEVMSMANAAISENPRVFDIGVAREAQRMRTRIFRPISIQRRANVIRFGEKAAAAVPAVAQAAVAARWTAPVNGPYDLPPAA